MKAKKALLLVLSSVVLSSCTKVNSGKAFLYAQGNESDYKGRIYYTDDYFRKDSTTYDDSLATTSLCFAMSSFASNRNKSGSDYTKRYRNVESFLKSAGFQYFSCNTYFKEKPQTDSLGAVYANKRIDDSTLIAIGIRGANYEMEWASNFTLGDNEKYHQGFYDASEILLDGLKEYIKSQSIHGRIKLWISGYSRAGATCNLSSGRLDDSIENSEPILPSQVSLKKEDLYSYCFEPPRGVIESAFQKDIHYDNIYNIVNFNDVVPLVAMKEFGFARYGIDMYLTDALFDENYSNNIEAVKKRFAEVDNYDSLGSTYYIDGFKYHQSKKKSMMNYRQGLYLRELLHLMTEDIESKDNYVSAIQSGLRRIMSFVYSSGVPKGSLIEFCFSLITEVISDDLPTILIDDLMHQSGSFAKDFMPILLNAFDKIGCPMDEKELRSSLGNLFNALIDSFKRDILLLLTLINKSNVSSIASGHYPELCLSHLMARDRNYTSSPISYDMEGKYYLIYGQQDISISITKNNELLAEFSQETCQVDNEITYGLDYDNSFICYLPYGQDYEVISNQKIQVFSCSLSKEKEEKIDLKAKSEGEKYHYSFSKSA